jgi:hypothetical protein
MKTTNLPQNNDVVTLLSKACAEVHGFDELYRRLERRMHTQRRSESTKKNYSRHLAQIALHYQCLPTILADDQIEDYQEGLTHFDYLQLAIMLFFCIKFKQVP